jgi:hypothetical protein
MATDLRERTPGVHTADRSRTRADHRAELDQEERRRYLVALVVAAVVSTVVGRLFGEDIALLLQRTPTTTLGWRFIGWLIAGPPLLIAIVTWHERRRLTEKQRRERFYPLAVWVGLSMFVLPARVLGDDSQFGTGALVGDPLSAGWAWAALADLLALAFAGLLLLVLRRSVDAPTRGQRDLTVRFLERAWVVLLVVSLGFALYGGSAGVVNGGS